MQDAICGIIRTRAPVIHMTNREHERDAPSPEEGEPQGFQHKLVDVVVNDFPEIENVQVSYPDEWRLVDRLARDELPFYVAVLPRAAWSADPDHFHGLDEEINLSLTGYRHYKLYEPWIEPLLPIAFDLHSGRGVVLPGGRNDLRLLPVAEAQVWTGEDVGVLWEGYAYDSSLDGRWQEKLAAFWHAVEVDMGVETIYTLPHDPDFPDGYTAFLTRLGYALDPAFPPWWSKR